MSNKDELVRKGKIIAIEKKIALIDRVVTKAAAKRLKYMKRLKRLRGE